MSSRNIGELLEEIPYSQRTFEQVARWRDGRESPTFRLLRNPLHLEEICRYGQNVAIWRDNGTLTYVSERGSKDSPVNCDQRYLLLSFYDQGPTMTIFGSTDDAAAETAAFFLSFEEPTEKSTCLVVRSIHGEFDFRAAGPQCLTRILEIVPSRRVELDGLFLSVEQSTALATSPHRAWLCFSECEFEDDGDAFVHALKNRRSSFGSLVMDSDGLNDDSLIRLLQVDVIDHLDLSLLENDELALLPLSANVDSLEYSIFSSSSLMDVDLQSLDIVARKLRLSIGYEEELFPTDLMLSFWRRVGELRHFEELEVVFHGLDYVLPDCVVPEIIRAVLANRNLKVLSLSDCYGTPEWGAHIETLLNGLKDHKQLRTLKIAARNKYFGPGFCHLRKFLSHHRNITVIDHRNNIYSDGLHVDKLYALNRFYRGSADLVKKPSPERPLLVATCLVESAANDFQRAGLLSSNHIDSLFELVQYARLDEHEDDSPLKRKRTNQPARAVKRTATTHEMP